jgi:hypothetical protein
LIRYSIVPRLSSIGLQARRAAGRAGERRPPSALIRRLRPHQDRSRPRRRAHPRNSRRLHQRDADRSADHRNVHLGARKKEIGIPERGAWQVKFDDNLSGQPCGPTQTMPSTNLAPAVGARHDAAARGDQRRNAAPPGDALQIAASEARPAPGWMIRLVASTTPARLELRIRRSRRRASPHR